MTKIEEIVKRYLLPHGTKIVHIGFAMEVSDLQFLTLKNINGLIKELEAACQVNQTNE